MKARVAGAGAASFETPSCAGLLKMRV